MAAGRERQRGELALCGCPANQLIHVSSNRLLFLLLFILGRPLGFFFFFLFSGLFRYSEGCFQRVGGGASGQMSRRGGGGEGGGSGDQFYLVLVRTRSRGVILRGATAKERKRSRHSSSSSPPSRTSPSRHRFSTPGRRRRWRRRNCRVAAKSMELE